MTRRLYKDIILSINGTDKDTGYDVFVVNDKQQEFIADIKILVINF